MRVSGGTFVRFCGNTTTRKLRLLGADDNCGHTCVHRFAEGGVLFFEFASCQNSTFVQGGVFWNSCPERDPIFFATKNIQSRFSAIPSAGGISEVEGGANVRLQGCTVWFADAISRALPTHPHVHMVVD